MEPPSQIERSNDEQKSDWSMRGRSKRGRWNRREPIQQLRQWRTVRVPHSSEDLPHMSARVCRCLSRCILTTLWHRPVFRISIPRRATQPNNEGTRTKMHGKDAHNKELKDG